MSFSQLPRFEAVSLLGSLIGMSSIYEGIPLQQLSVEPQASHPKDTKERVLNLLIRSSKKEPSGMGRSVALNCLGIFMYNELSNRSHHPRLSEVANVLVSATKVSISHFSKLALEYSTLHLSFGVALLFGS